MHSLARGGFPFSADDLTIEEWMDLGVLKEELESRKEQGRMSVLLAARSFKT